ncbi:hypothetical protein CEE37_07310 [candidate division LCP-89 bacterium B3_LCP]|uniref:PEGA domain-containing protein n=1 Tax=candidate division LCP-89 bacterium B3_LCP TaxID=2012998 RepID=A0A532V0M6_UNCL8|nr:MAG: hypothetical protein CEE37_07310 [candidate division LCP-89 bacterium B3_LCP]
MRADQTHSHSGMLIVCALIITVFLIWGCGNLPVTIVDKVGSVQVNGVMPDSSPADSVHVTLDDGFLGTFPNPHTLTTVIGTHLLEVGSIIYPNPGDTIEYFSAPQYVTVQEGQTTQTQFDLEGDLPVAPYEGFLAPEIALYDLDDNLVTLSVLTGDDKIVLAYFFEYG